MSTKVTTTMTVTETSTSSPPKLGLNLQVLKTKDALLKLFEALIAIICMTLALNGFIAHAGNVAPLSTGFFFLCLIGGLFPTLLLLITYLISPLAASTIPKMIYDFLNNVVSSLFYVITSMSLLIIMSQDDSEESWKSILVAVMGLVNSILYFLSAYFSYQTFKSS